MKPGLRQQIQQPKMTPPLAEQEAAVAAAMATGLPLADVRPAAVPPPAVAPPAPPAPAPATVVKLAPPLPPSMKVTAAGIELTNPTIELPHAIFVGGVQVEKIKPAFALITHGVIVIAEKNLVLPMAGGTVIRS